MRDRLRFESGRRHGDRRGARRKGAALVIVMIFGVGALMLVLTMLALSENSVKQSGELHSQKALVAVLKTGFTEALNEIKRDDALTTGEYDPDNDGIGALVGAGGAGIEVRGASGRLLGRYRATVFKRTSPNRTILRVVAAYPDFTNPRSYVAGEAEVSRTALFGDANPLSIVHDVSTTAGSKFTGIAQTNLTITAPDKDVPAVNVTSTWLWNEFTDDVVNSGEDVTITGADPTDPGTLVSGSATVTNGSEGVLDEQLMLSTRAAIVDKAQTGAASPDGTLPHDPGDRSLGTDPDAVYYASNGLDIHSGKTVTGTGTLIIQGKLEVKGELNWTGTVIVMPDVSDPDTGTSDVELESGGKFHVDGYMFQIGQNTDLLARPGGAADRGVTGGWLFLAADDGDVTMNFMGGSGSYGFQMDGIMASYGNTTKIDMANGMNFDLTGSLALVNQTSQSDNKIDINIPGKLYLEFDDPVFRTALDELSGYLPEDDPNKPIVITSYWERSAKSILEDQNTQLASGSSWGKED